MAVTNYLYQYPDGSTGNSPFQLDAQGNVITNAQGGVTEGLFLGRTMPDGSVNQSPMGNVTANGMVDLYGGYQSPADVYYGNGNADIFGGSNVGQRPPNGYGYGTSAQPGGTQSVGGIPGSGGSYGSAAGDVSTSTVGQNPYLSQLGDMLASTMTSNFNRNQLPALGSQFAAAGGYGGSRQGVIEANALNDLNAQIGNALTGLYGNGFNTSLNYDLGLRNNQLGFGNLGLGYANLDRMINNDNIANQMQGVNLGLNVWDRLNANNQTGINAGNTIQNTPLNYWQQFGQQANSIGQGYGTQTSSGSTQGNPMLGALGGAQLGSQIGNWWSGGSGTGLTGVNAPSSGYQIGSFDYGLGNGSSGLGLRY